MHFSLSLPFLFLIPMGLAHGSPLARGHTPHAHARRSQSSRRQGASIAEEMKRGLLGDLDGDDDTNSTASTSASAIITSTAKTTSSIELSSSIVSSSSALLASITTAAGTSTTTSKSSSAGVSTGTILSSASGTSSAIASLVTSALNSTATSSASSVAIISAPATANASTSTAQSSAAAQPQTSSAQYTTDAAGQTQLVTVFETATAAGSGSETPSVVSAASTTSTSSSSDGDAISTPAIIGISVPVGAVVIALIAFAVWRMKRRAGDEDEAIRWPELNRHGDSDVHHALPARQTGQHGFETNPLQRSLSNSSSLFSPSSVAPPHSAVPMALNGSNFGAASSLEEDYMSEKYGSGPASHDDHENYTSLPPPLQMDHTSGASAGMYGTSQDEHSYGHEMDHDGDIYGGMTMDPNSQHVTYSGLAPASSSVPMYGGRQRIE